MKTVSRTSIDALISVLNDYCPQIDTMSFDGEILFLFFCGDKAKELYLSSSFAVLVNELSCEAHEADAGCCYYFFEWSAE